MKKLLFAIVFLFPLFAVAQPATATITSDGSTVTISTPFNSKQVAVCDFHWLITDWNLRLWVSGSNEIIPGGRLKYFVVSGVTDNNLKDEALGAITDQCGGGSGLDSLYYGNDLLENGDTIPTASAPDATEVLLNPAINFGGVNTTDVQAALAAIDIRLDTAMLGKNLGNILFVSTTGNNSTALKGYLNKPYADPQAAVTASTSGDMVWMLPGTWAFGSAGTFVITNLAKAGVTLYMAPGAKLVQSGTASSTLFLANAAGNFKLVGNGQIEVSGCQPAGASHRDAVVVFELDRLYAFGGSTSGTISAFSTNSPGFKKLNFSLKDFETAYNTRCYGPGWFNNYYPDSTGIQAKARADIWVGNYNAGQGPASNRPVIFVSDLINTDVNVRYDNITNKNDFDGGWGFGFSDDIKNSNISISIGNGRFSPISGSTYDLVQLNLSASDTLTNANISFHCDNCELTGTTANVFSTRSNGAPTTNSSFRITGNYVTTGALINASIADGGLKYYANVNHVSSNAANVNCINASPIRLQGYYKTTKTATNNISLDGSATNMALQNCVFVNDASVANVGSSAAVSVPFMGCYGNSVIDDADVTEVVTPLVQNSNVK